MRTAASGRPDLVRSGMHRTVRYEGHCLPYRPSSWHASSFATSAPTMAYAPGPCVARQLISTYAVVARSVGGGYGYFKKGSAKSLGAGLGAALILALCARSMVGPAGVGPARVAFGEWRGSCDAVCGM